MEMVPLVKVSAQADTFTRLSGSEDSGFLLVGVQRFTQNMVVPVDNG